MRPTDHEASQERLPLPLLTHTSREGTSTKHRFREGTVTRKSTGYCAMLFDKGSEGDTQVGPMVITGMPFFREYYTCLLYTSPSPRDQRGSRMPSSA